MSRFDFAWPQAKVALEYEGAYHFEDGQIARDDERVDRLRAAGWIVIRISAADLRTLDAVVEQVRLALAVPVKARPRCRLPPRACARWGQRGPSTLPTWA